jgi:hypothetical protein
MHARIGSTIHCMHVNLVQGWVHVNVVQRAAAHKSSHAGLVVHDATAVSTIYTGPKDTRSSSS